MAGRNVNVCFGEPVRGEIIFKQEGDLDPSWRLKKNAVTECSVKVEMEDPEELSFHQVTLPERGDTSVAESFETDPLAGTSEDMKPCIVGIKEMTVNALDNNWFNAKLEKFGRTAAPRRAAANQGTTKVLPARVIGTALVIFSGFAIDEVVNHWHWRHTEGQLLSSMHTVALFLGFAQLLTSALLVVGVVRERPAFLRPWIVFFSVQTALLLLAALACSVLTIIYIEPVPLGIFLFLVAITYVYTFRFFILVVYSYYRQLMIVTPGGATAAGVMQLA